MVQPAVYSLLGINVMIFDRTHVEATLQVTLEYQYFPFKKNSSSSYLSESGLTLVMEEHSSFLGLIGFKSLNSATVRFDSLIVSLHLSLPTGHHRYRNMLLHHPSRLFLQLHLQTPANI